MRKFIITAELRDITDRWDNTNREDSISYSKMVELLNEKALKYAQEYADPLIKPTYTAKEVLRVVSCNGMREMTEDRILQAMEEYARQKLSEFMEKFSDLINETNQQFSNPPKQ